MNDSQKGPLIVGLGHRRRVGKDSVAGFLHWYLQERANTSVETASFAYQLKMTAYNLFRCAGLQAPNWYDKHPEMREVPLPELGKSPRDIWIEVGNKLRDVDPEIWIRNASTTAPSPRRRC